MPFDQLPAVVDGARYGVALVTTGVLLLYTYRRVVAGSDEDPSIALSYGGRQGYVSFLVTGVAAAAFVAGGWILSLSPEIMEQPALALIPLALVVGIGIVEVRES
ncbi:hypothetical protein [Haloglomus litoreum]|uniref:hypothetical protein n=1 Tax=Haloglomus litoreum TaxID=3034026 RepID=UPI0023E80215|nr:hypothetical protein [Haloglomus sp. DT116]